MEIYHENKTYSASNLLDCCVHSARSSAIAYHYSWTTAPKTEFLAIIFCRTRLRRAIHDGAAICAHCAVQNHQSALRERHRVPLSSPDVARRFCPCSGSRTDPRHRESTRPGFAEFFHCARAAIIAVLLLIILTALSLWRSKCGWNTRCGGLPMASWGRSCSF